MADNEDLIAAHHRGGLLNLVYSLGYTPGELEHHAREIEASGEPVIAEILRATAAALIVTQRLEAAA